MSDIKRNGPNDNDNDNGDGNNDGEARSGTPIGLQSQDALLARMDRQFSDFNTRLSAATNRFEQLVTQASSAIVEQVDSIGTTPDDTAMGSEAPSPAPAPTPAAPAPTPAAPALTRNGDETPSEALQRAEATCRARTRALTALTGDVRTSLEELSALIHPLESAKRVDDAKRQGVVASKAGIASLMTHMDMLQDIGVIATGTLETDKTVFDLHRLVNEGVAELMPLAVAKNLDFSCRIEPGTPQRVAGDPARIWQVLSYVTHRAIRFAAQGKVTINVNQKYCTDSANVIRIAVDNAGTGMPDEQLDSLQHWSAFDESSGNESMVYLRDGLTRCGELLSLMGGQVGIDSAAKRGFAIWFTVSFARPGSGSDERTSNRALQEMLHCNLGPVVDLSPGGIKVVCRRPPRRKVAVIILDSTERVKLKAEVVWTKNIGPKNCEVGLRFIGISSDQEVWLERISSKHGFGSQAGKDAEPTLETSE